MCKFFEGINLDRVKTTANCFELHVASFLPPLFCAIRCRTQFLSIHTTTPYDVFATPHELLSILAYSNVFTHQMSSLQSMPPQYVADTTSMRGQILLIKDSWTYLLQTDQSTSVFLEGK